LSSGEKLSTSVPYGGQPQKSLPVMVEAKCIQCGRSGGTDRIKPLTTMALGWIEPKCKL